ncbi:MAG: dihydrodipicolinate synthase family protein [Alphaproteobacteria bacterium]|nr:MAG: dihydrodipicolinate synthase family protein [Alphaproteobacteria bacterium]
MKPNWSGCFPAITTQMNADQSVNLDATAKHIDVLVESGVSGLVMLGSLGENNSLTPAEKREVMQVAIQTVNGRIPVLSGVSESSTAAACAYARDIEKMGANGMMLLPAMSYRSDPRETMVHFRTVARASGLPIICYNNPIAYSVDITPLMFAELADEPNLVAIKESSADVRRLTDIRNVVGDRYTLFTGVDDLALESIFLGAEGWISGVGIAFPKENNYLWELTQRGEWEKAREIYRWYMPLLHLDTHVKFVQYIKLAVQEAGFGTEWVRAPRLTLEGAEREAVLAVIHKGLETRPEVAAR